MVRVVRWSYPKLPKTCLIVLEYLWLNTVRLVECFTQNSAFVNFNARMANFVRFPSAARSFSSLPSPSSSKGWQVSSYGRCCSSHGIVSAGYLHPNGYRQVKICGQNYNVHRVVMLAFNGPPPNEQAWQVHHKDGDKANNRLDNLEYVTRSQNMLHSHALSTRRGSEPAQSKPVMWRRLGTENWTLSPSGRQAAEQLGLTQSMVSTICNGKASSQEFEIQFQKANPSSLTGEKWRPMLDPASGDDQVCKRMVSSFGRVMSNTGLISKGTLTRSGYYVTSITCTPVPKRVVAVHRLVAFAFLGPPPCVSSTHVNHKDSDKGNNSADNLEWVSPARNMCHFHENSSINRRNGKKPVLSRAHTDEWTLHCSSYSAASSTGVDRWSIWRCCHGRLVQTRGHEFKFADIDEAKSLPGEEWREVDIKALRDDRIANKRIGVM